MWCRALCWPGQGYQRPPAAARTRHQSGEVALHRRHRAADAAAAPLLPLVLAAAAALAVVTAAAVAAAAALCILALLPKAAAAGAVVAVVRVRVWLLLLPPPLWLLLGSRPLLRGLACGGARAPGHPSGTAAGRAQGQQVWDVCAAAKAEATPRLVSAG